MSTRVSFRSYAGQYFTVSPGTRAVAATTANVGPNEGFTRIDLGDRRIALQAHDGSYVGVDGSGALIADRRTVGPAETFTLLDGPDGRVALRAGNGMLVCAEGGGGQAVLANRVQVGPWELLRVDAAPAPATPAPPAPQVQPRSTWRDLFGSPDFAEADAGRSVYAPAAYLADLLQLLEDELDAAADLHARRPDITRDILLNGEQSFTTVPQLDLVNRVLAARIAAVAHTDADAALASARHPHLLPYEHADERVARLLPLLKVTHRDVHASLGRDLDVDVLARERLGLSPARAAVVLLDTAGDVAALRLAFGLPADADLASLADLETFRRATGLDAQGLRDLLFARLSEDARDVRGTREREAAGRLFVHQGLAGYVGLDDEGARLVWRGAGQGIPPAWFDRVHRLLRLARWTGLGLVDLERALRVLCDGKLDARALRRLAVVVDLQGRTGESFETLVAVLGGLAGDAALGASDGDPASLFDRVFNGDPARIARRYVASGATHLPARYVGWDELVAGGDLLADVGRNKELRARVQRALDLSPRELAAVLELFRARAAARGRTTAMADGLGPAGLSALHRVARLARLTRLAPLDLLRLVDVLEHDPSVHQLDGFGLLVHADPGTLDLYRVLEQGPVDAQLWLVQTVLAVATWAAAAGLTPADLAAATLAPEPPAPAAAATVIDGNTTRRVFLQADGGRYITVETSGARRVVADADSVGASEVFTVIDLGLGRVQLQARSGRYAGVDGSGALVADRAAAGPAETFTLVDHGGGRVSLRAANGRYLGPDIAGARTLRADRADAGPAETFRAITVATDAVLPPPVQSPILAAPPAPTPLSPEDAELLRLSRAILDAFLPTALAPAQLASEIVDPRTARIAAALAREPARGLVAADPRIAVRDDAAAAALAHAALAATDVVTVVDLEELQLGESLAGHLADLLARRGLVDGDGVLRDDRVPDRPDDLEIESDWAELAAPVCDLLHAQYAADLAEGTPADEIQLALYPADLRALGFEPADADEFLAHLAFLGVLDDAGGVTVPALFAGTDALANLWTDLGLDDHHPAIHAFLADLRARWLDTPLVLPEDVWAALALTDGEREALAQNLEFNGHIDAARRIVDRRALLALTPEKFDLALPFYRQRRQILATLQEFVAAARRAALGLDAARLRPLADHLVAASAHAALARADLDASGRPGPDLRQRLAAPGDPGLDLGPLPSDAQHPLVADLLRRILADADALRLTDAALAAVDLSGEHAERVVATLTDAGVLRPDRTLAPDRLPAFTRVGGALEFTLPGYTDYTRDVFFLLHDVAVAVDARVAALTAALRDVAEAQRAATLEALAGAFELTAPALDAILAQVLPDAQGRASALLAPILAAAGRRAVLEAPPADRSFRAAIRRTRQFAGFAARLRMTPGEIEVAFRDQQLVHKFPEPFALPPGVDRIDALWTDHGQLHLFLGARFWTLDAATMAPLAQARPLSALSPEFADLPAVDAVYTTASGVAWLLAAGRTWQRAAGSDRWARVDRVWGRVLSRFDDPERIDGALLDDDGKLSLFAGDQYVRYSRLPQPLVDEGYPRRIAAHWPQELGFGPLPAGWTAGIDAAVGRRDEVTWLFRGDKFVASTDPGNERPITDTWGRVRHDLAAAARVDAVLDLDGRCVIVVGDQATAFGGCLEGPGLTADPGFPRSLAALLPGLPEAFSHGLDAGLVDQDGTLHLFRDQTHAARAAGQWTTAPTRERWGRVRNTLHDTGRVDAALCGLDGKIYLFSGDQYVRYSTGDFSRVDEGYPRSIARDWGGLARVDAAFALDGKTYLFGSRSDRKDDAFYLRYSSRDYTRPDDGYPRATDDNFWNLPQSLVDRFAAPHAVFVGPDGRTHLFAGDSVISFGHNHRWWSEPAPVRDAWQNLPFARVDAAFTARDGRTYFFGGDDPAAPQLFARFSDPACTRVDDRFPRPVQESWGKLVNNLARTGRVDAAVTVVSTVTLTDAQGAPFTARARYRYLFSGDQFYRSSSDDQAYVDEGYPLRIQDALRREPHFVHLDAPAARGVDGVWADAGNVAVFLGDRVHVAATARVREPVGSAVPHPRAPDLDEGRLVVCSDGAWTETGGPESLSERRAPATPRPLRRAPAAFQGPLSAILRGLDGRAYLFAQDRCWDPALAREFPTGAAWGVVRNLVAEDERVDAALWGRDGKLTLFRGDQFLRYTPAAATPAELPALADAAPAPIAAHWGGLADVRHAWVRDGVTYLLESPDESGGFRYVRYSGADYTRPDDPAPRAADASFWGLPADLLADGWGDPDAVFSEQGDLVLIRGRRFVHLDAGASTWTSPRPLALRWPGLPTRVHDFEDLAAVVASPDGATLLFSAGAWLRHDGRTAGDLTAIAARWGRLDNRITRANRVDAALVLGEHTFLFSGDQYVRYTGPDYRYVDRDYPRPIARRLREEDGFRDLPEDLETSLARLGPDDVWVSAAYASDGALYVHAAGRTFAVARALTRTYPLARFAGLRNELLRRARVDAAFRRDDGALFLLSGDQYVRYSRVDLDVVDDGYPRAIADDLLRELAPSAPDLPPAFQFDLDAAFLAGGALVLFKDKQFVRFDTHAPTPLTPLPIKDAWGRAGNAFLPTPQDPTPRLDAAFLTHDGALLVFKGDRFLRYADPAAETADEGYPAAIRDRFGDLPPAYEAGIDGAFVFDGRTYLARGDHHVRFTDPTLTRVDPVYPLSFASRFGRANDYLLRDLRIVQEYVALDQDTATDATSLTEFLLKVRRENADPYALLAGLFAWEVDDVQWLKRRDAFLRNPDRELATEVRFDIEQALRIHATMAVATRLGTHPRLLLEQVWQPLWGASPRDPVAAADNLQRMLGALYPGDDWRKIERQLVDALNTARRDAQVAWLMHHEPVDPAREPPRLEEVRDLSNLLLTDVEMDASVDTSAVREAISALQLYFHRYLLSLERQGDAPEDQDRRARFKRRWRWLKNYRVWEANRKVFLYPESYLRPELRDTRTHAFRTLQDDLLQGEITDASVTSAYKKYLDEYTQVSRLVIAGGFVQPGAGDPADRELMLFGFTRTQPRTYYYRNATFLRGDAKNAAWRAWRPLGVEINAERVHPVRAFGRAFVFWVELEQKSPSTSSTSLKIVDTSGGKQVSRDENPENHITVSYSFYDLNEQWSAPQRLKVLVERGKVQDLRLRVTRADEPDAGERILVSCHYGTETTRLELPPIRPNGSIVAIATLFGRMTTFGVVESRDLRSCPRAGDYSPEQLTALAVQFGGREVVDAGDRHPAVSLSADLEVRDAGELPAADRRSTLIASLFAEPIDPARTLELSATSGSGDGAWYSVDVKGGSFLALPTVPPLTGVRTGVLADNPDGLPSWNHVDACLAASDGNVYLFRGQVFARRGQPGEHPADEPLAARWGLRRTRVLAERRVDAAWWRDGILHLSRGNEVLTHSDGTLLADPVGPHPLPPGPQDALNVPDWPDIQAAFTAADKTTWFFRVGVGGPECVRIDADGQRAADPRPWGRARSEFAGPDAHVVAAFADGPRTFLVGPTTFTWYDRTPLDLCEPPRPQSLRAVLEVLGAAAQDPLPDAAILAAFALPGALVLKVAPAAAPRFFRVQDRKAAQIPDAQVGDMRLWISATTVGLTTYTVTAGPRLGLQERSGELVRVNLAHRYDPELSAVHAAQGDLYAFARGRPAIRVDIGAPGIDGAGKAPLLDASLLAWSGQPWSPGRVRDAFARGVDAALRRGDHTFLVADDTYARYTGGAYDLVDPGYPRPLAGNPDGLPTRSFDAAVEVDGRTCFFLDDRVAWSDDLAATTPLTDRCGRVRTNILTSGVDAAYVLGARHYLISGDEVALYNAGPNGQLPLFMDQLLVGAPAFAAESGRRVDAIITLGDRAYLFTGAYFHALPPASVIDAVLAGLGPGTAILGGWDNLPALFNAGIDAAIQTPGELVLLRGDRYARYASDVTPSESGRGRYDLVRLTTSTAAALNRRLFEGGVPGLLELRSQQFDEMPGFSTTTSGPTTVQVHQDRVNMDMLPTSGSLDFASANGLYYWEIFYHAPLLVADTLGGYQRYDEARTWYQHVFDPTAPGELWKFLPFLTVDPGRLVGRVRDLLARGDWQGSPAALEFESFAADLVATAPAFRGERDLTPAQLARLAQLADLTGLRARVAQLDTGGPPGRPRLQSDLLELVGTVEELKRRWEGMQSSAAQIAAYLDDPIDPHAIAALRPIAYRKAAVLGYIDNLLDWGDALFAQYTRESIDEARMLYVQAWDLLGRRPESLGRRPLPPDSPYAGLRNVDPAGYDLLLVDGRLQGPPEHLSFAGSVVAEPHASIARSYFFIPPNEELHAYWTRVEDRLYKIRHSQNLQGVRAPLALFEPPLDPMALVRAVAGGGLAALSTALGAVDVPHYRFSVLINQAQALADKASQLASDLLLTLEKRDAEELYRLQTRFEGEILALTVALNKTQLAEAEANKTSLERARDNARKREDTYGGWIDGDYIALERAQIGLLSGVALTHFVSAVLQGVRQGASAIPRALIGLFIAGVESPEPEKILESAANMTSSLASGLQSISEILGITAQHERMKNDWKLQRDLAAIDGQQIDAQIRGADLQIAAARQQIAMTERQVHHNESVATFYRAKFTNKELYQWMVGRLSGIHNQTYQLALNLARAAERAYQFERGRPERDTSFIQGQYWDSQRQGLTAAAALSLDLARMQAAFLATDERRFEIARNLSLVQLDPRAFLQLKSDGACEFDLGEALFDRDFPGHYARQVKTIAVNLVVGEGVFPNATLTQLSSRVVMEPDTKAVAFLLDPTESPPLSIRHNWRPLQQAAITRPDDGEKNNGVFSRFDTDRYLPFEGTGAVSRWRLELGGSAGTYDPRDLADVVLELKYTARQGGEAFAASVRSLLKPTDALRAFDLARDFPDDWNAFLAGDADLLTVTLRPGHFPGMAGGRIPSIFTRYITTDQPGAATFTLEGPDLVRLADGKTVDTAGLTIRPAGTPIALRLKGDRAALRTVYLLLAYKEGVR